MAGTQNSRPVGMLGLGSMGGPMAINLARAGFAVYAYDPRPEALQVAAEAGVVGCESAADVARAASIVLAIPFDYTQVEQAVLGPRGVVEGWQAPGLLVLMSTVGPDSARLLGRRLAERGHRLVDSPVSGGHVGAVEGTLTLMVGGADEDVEQCRPFFQAVAANVFHVGTEVGAGQAAKLANQLLVVTNLVAAAEALTLGARSGVDPRLLYEIISTSAGNSWMFRTRGPAILDRSFKTGGSLSILVKDARLVLQAAQAAGVPLFAASAAGQVFESARDVGLGGEDDAAVAKLYELLSGGQPLTTPGPDQSGSSPA